MKPELNHHMLVYVTILCQLTSYLNSTTTVPVRPYRLKGGTNDVSLDAYLKMRNKTVFSPTP